MKLVRKQFLAKVIKAATEKAPVTVVISTENPDRYGDTVACEGWDLENFKKNPVVLYGHDRYGKPCGRALNVRVEEGALKAEVEFAPTEEAQEIEALVRGGFINAVSAGFWPIEYGPRKDESHEYAIAFLKQELLEFSFVTVPANPEAVVESREADRDELVSKLFTAAPSRPTPAAPAHPEEKQMNLEELKKSLEKAVAAGTMTKEQADAVFKAAEDSVKAAEEEAKKKAAAAPQTFTAEQVQKMVDAAAEKAAKAAVEKALTTPVSDPTAPIVKAAGEPFRPTPGLQVGKDQAEGTGINAVRMIKAIAVARMSSVPMSPVDVAKRWGYELVAKALNTTNLSEGAILLAEQFSAEFIPLLRNFTVVEKAGARRLPMTGPTMKFRKQSSAGTAYYGEEGDSIAPSQPAFGSRELQEKKLTSLVVESNDLLRNPSTQAEEMVRDDMLQVMGLARDSAFLRGTGASSAPMGITNQVDATHKYAETIVAAGAPTLAEIRKERNLAIKKLKAANIPLDKVAWVFNARTELSIKSAIDAQGNPVFEKELSEGRWGSFPVFVTEQVPENLGQTGNRAELVLCAFGQCIIGESMAMEVEVFPNGTYEEGGSVKSGINRDQSVIRAIEKHDFLMRYPKGAVVVTGLSWGITQ